MTTNRPFEAEFRGLSKRADKSGDWFKLELWVHPDEFPNALYNVPLRTRVGVVLAQINDDNAASKIEENPGETKGSDRTSTAKRPFHELPRSQQAGILCNDERFAEWLKTTDPAREIRRRCHVQSRADLNEGHPYFDPASAAIFDNLVSDYRQAMGQEARRD